MKVWIYDCEFCEERNFNVKYVYSDYAVSNGREMREFAYINIPVRNGWAFFKKLSQPEKNKLMMYFYNLAKGIGK